MLQAHGHTQAICAAIVGACDEALFVALVMCVLDGFGALVVVGNGVVEPSFDGFVIVAKINVQ